MRWVETKVGLRVAGYLEKRSEVLRGLETSENRALDKNNSFTESLSIADSSGIQINLLSASLISLLCLFLNSIEHSFLQSNKSH